MTISDYQSKDDTTRSLTSSTRRLLKKCSKADDQKGLGEDVKHLTKLWENVHVGQLIAEGASPNVLQGFIHHIDQIEDASELTPLCTQLFHVERIIRNNMYGAATAENHLASHLGNDYSKHSFAPDIESFYDSLGSEIDLKMLFHIFADEWGAGRTTFKKESLEGDDSFRFLNLYEKMCRFYRSIPEAVDREQIEADYASAKALTSQIRKVCTPGELETVCDGIEERLKNLKAGESQFIPGGWSGYPAQSYVKPKVEGHAMMYQISKGQDNTYSIRIYNSGAGLKYHQILGAPDKHNPAVEWWGLSEERATDGVFWQQILEAQVIPGVLQHEENRPKTYGDDFIYQEFQEHLKTDCPHPRAAVELAALKDQRAGICSRKASDMIGRARKSGNDFKRLRLEEQVAGFGLLSYLIKKGALSPSDQKFAKELYIKTLPKIWVALSKYHQQYEPDSLTSTVYLIATLKDLEKEEWKRVLAPQIRLQMVDKPIPATISVDTMGEIHKNTRTLRSQEIPLLHMATVGAESTTSLENLSPIEQLMRSLTSSISRLSVGMEHADSLDMLSQLQSEVYERLPPPTGIAGVAFWKEAIELKRPELEQLLKNLQISGWMNHQASHQLGQMLPQTILNAWKTYAAVTYVLRNRPDISDILKGTPVSWAHFNAVYDHPLFSQFTGKFAEEAQAIRDFFQQDSAGGAALTGEDLSEVSKVPLFDYSWKNVSLTERDKIPEVSCPENYVKQQDNRKRYDRCVCAWSQIAQLAERAIFEEFNPQSADASSYTLTSDRPLETLFKAVGVSIENKTPSGPAELNLHRGLWESSRQTEPFLKRLWSQQTVEQSGVIRELNEQGKQADEASYHLDMISSADPSLKLHLLLSYFEEHPSKLLEKDLLDYFMAHLHAGRFLADTLEREPLFLQRLLKFLDRFAEEDSKKPHNDLSFQRMLHVFYTTCKVHQAAPTNPTSATAVEKMRDHLSKMPLTDPEKISRRARYMLASYSLAPPTTLHIADYFQYIFENKQMDVKGGFEAFMALEASRFHLTVLPELLKAMQEEAKRSQLLSSILQPKEKALTSRSIVPKTVNQELLTLQSKLIAERAKWDKDYKRLEDYKKDRVKELESIHLKLTQNTSYSSTGRPQEHILQLEKEVETESEEAPLDLDKVKKEDKVQLEFYNSKIEKLEKSLPTMQQRIDSAAKLSDLLEELPEKWILVGNILLIKDLNTILEIDLALGRIYRNGLTLNKGSLPPSIQQSQKCAPFGKGLQAEALQEGGSFVLQKKGFEHVTFKSNFAQDVILKLDTPKKVSYTLLDVQTMNDLKLPESFKNKPVSGWIDASSFSAEIVLCLHDDEGRPIPSFLCDSTGVLHMFDRPELFLFKSVPENVLRVFQGMGINPNNAFCWMDHKGNAARIDLPLKDLNNNPLSFDKTKEGWVLASNPSLRVCSNQNVPDLGVDDYHLVLENREGKKNVQIPYDPFEEFYRAAEGKEGSGPAEKFPLVYSFEWTPEGLQSAEPGAKLLLMYRHIKNTNYRQALELLKSGVTPVGKPYSIEELKFLDTILRSYFDHHVESCVLRIVLNCRVRKHLERWEKEEYTGDKLEKLKSASPPTGFFVLQTLAGRGNMGQWLKDYYQGANPSERMTLGALLSPEEELELLQREGGYLERVIELKKLTAPQDFRALRSHKQPRIRALQAQEKEKYDWKKDFFSENYLTRGLMADKGGFSIRDNWLTPSFFQEFKFRQCYEVMSNPREDNLKLRKKILILAEKTRYSKEAELILELAEKVQGGLVLPSFSPNSADAVFLPRLAALFVDEEQKEKVCKELFEIEKSLKINPGTPTGLGTKQHIRQAIAQLEKAIQEIEELNKASQKIENQCLSEFHEDLVLVMKDLIEKVQKYREVNPERANSYDYSSTNKTPSGLALEEYNYSKIVEMILTSSGPIEDLAKELAAVDCLMQDTIYVNNRKEVVKKKYEARLKDLKLSLEALKQQTSENIAQLINYRSAMEPSDSDLQTWEKLLALRQTLLDISQLLPKEIEDLNFQVFAPLLSYRELVFEKEGNPYAVANNLPKEMIDALSLDGKKYNPHPPLPIGEMLKRISGALQHLKEATQQGDQNSGKFLAALFPLLKTDVLPKEEVLEMISEAKEVLADIERYLNPTNKRRDFEKVQNEAKYTHQDQANRIIQGWNDPLQATTPPKRECYDFNLALKELEQVKFVPIHQQIDKQWLVPCPPHVNKALLVDEAAWNELNPEEKQSLDPLLKGLEEYRLTHQNETSYRLDQNHIQELQVKTAQELFRLIKKSGDLEKSILELANTLPVSNQLSILQSLREQGGHKHILNTKECIYFALQNDAGVWKANTHLGDEQIADIQAKVVAYLVLGTEIQHFHRGNVLLLRSLKSPDEELLAEIGTWAASKRSYELKEDCIHHLVFEYYAGYAGMRMRKEQKELIDELSGLEISPTAKGKVVQLIMGAGKSKVIGPILAIMAADGYRVSTFCFTSGLYGTGIADFSQTAWQLFGRISDTLQFSRGDCTTENLHRLVIQIQHAIDARKVLLHRPKDLLSMKMMIDERDEQIHQIHEQMAKTVERWIESEGPLQNRQTILDYVLKGDELQADLTEKQLAAVQGLKQSWTEKGKLIEDYQAQIDILENIVKLFSRRQDAQFDEWDTLADPKNQVSFPIGDPVQASSEGIDKACELYFQLLPKYEEQLRIAGNGQTLAIEGIRKKVQKELAKDVWELYRELLTPFKIDEQPFLAYLKNEDAAQAHDVYETLNTMSTSPSGINRKLTEEVAFYKYALNGGLDNALQADGNVSYGRSKIDPSQELAIPYEDNDVPKEGTRFRAVWETALKSCQYYRQNWNKTDQTAKLLGYFLNQDALEGENQQHFEDIRALFGPEGQIDLSSAEHLSEYMKILRKGLKPQDPHHLPALRLIRHYLQYVVFARQLQKDIVQITANPYDLVHIPGSSKGFSGTRSFADTWSSKVEATPSPHTDAMTIDALTEKENRTCLLIDPHQNFVDQLLDNPSMKDVSAIIDAAPIFKGVDSARLARQLLQACHSYGVKKRVIIYSHDDGKGVSTLALLKSGAKEPIFLADSSKETLKKALGEIPFEEVLTLYDRAHTVGLDVFQHKGAVAYVTIGDQLTKDRLLQAALRMRQLILRGHHVKFVMTRDVAELIGKTLHKDPALIDSRDIIRYTKLVQDSKEIAANPFALRDEIRYHVKAAIRTAKAQAATPEERKQLHAKYRGRLLQVQNLSLFAEYGKIDVELDTIDILKKEMTEALKILEELGGNGGLIKDLEHRLHKIPLPKKMKSSDRLSDATIEIEQSAEKDQQKELEQLKDINLDYEGTGKTPTIQKQWPENLEDTDLFHLSPYGISRGQVPALYPLSDCHPSFAKVFDDTIAASENWVKTFIDHENSLLTKDGRPIHHVLVVQEGNSKPKMVLLTPEESKQWVDFLVKRKTQTPSQRKIWLVEPGGELIQSSIAPWKDTSFSKELVQLLFLKGDAIKLASDPIFPHLENWAKVHPNKSQLRPLFESILSLQEDNYAFYLRNKKLAKAIS
jgi:hypothetical protein